jgi:hypothetical protein
MKVKCGEKWFTRNPEGAAFRGNLLTLGIVFLLATVLSGCAHTEERATLNKTVLQPIIGDLVSGHVTELRILYAGYVTTPFPPLTEQSVESRPFNVKDVFLPLDESRRMALVEALQRTQLKSLPGPRDYWCGLVFYGNERRRLYAIWLERPWFFERGRSGTIDGYRVKMTGPLSKWIEKHLE